MTAITPYIVIVGLGATGLSVARHLARSNQSFLVNDSRTTPPGQDEFLNEFSRQQLITGGLDQALLNKASQLIVNPGMPLSTDEIQQAIAAGVEVVVDTELFAREQARKQQDLVAITGSNGKTTVTAMIGAMADSSGKNIVCCGNYGVPTLDALADDVDAYALELSSYQLETTRSLNANGAVILNISEDHLERYDGDMQAYADTKGLLYQQCQTAVVNLDDARAAAYAENHPQRLTYSTQLPAGQSDYGLLHDEQGEWLARGTEKLLNCQALKVVGQHNISNALAALALAETLKIPMAARLEALREYTPMPHRMQVIKNSAQCRWINDSKATNVAATEAALIGLSGSVQAARDAATIILLLGGQGKGADFTPLNTAVKGRVKQLIVYGEDAGIISQAMHNSIPLKRADSLEHAVKIADQCSQAGDTVLLSPACASFDMYDNYMQRGEAFSRYVEALDHAS